MDEIKIKELWHSSNEKLEQSFLLSKKNTEDITKMKVQSLLSSMKPLKIFSILLGILWVGLGSVIIIRLFINSFERVSPFFLFSATFQLLLTGVALIIYLYQLILIYNLDISEPILATQEKLTSLRSSTLWAVRILFLQLPLWTTFYWNENMLQNWNLFQWMIQGVITLFFTFSGAWLFIHIKYENKDKKWFKLIFDGKEWTPVMKAMQLYKEIEEFKQDN